MRGEVLDGVERRRRWSDEEKLRILMEVGLRGSTLTDVARRHSVSRSQLYAWRRELKRHGAMRPPEVVEGRPVFVPVAPPLLPGPVSGPLPSGDVASTAPRVDCEGPEPPAPAIEVALTNGRRLCVPPGIDDAALARLIRVVEGA
ncbi:MAG: transposase [Pseudomonadota bacterium]